MFRDIQYALRTLRGAPAFAITVVLTLGIGLGLNTTLFTLFNAYVLRPFAVKDPYSLYHFGWRTTRFARQGLTWRQYQDLRTEAPVFSDIVGCSPVITRVESRNVYGMAVSGNYFAMLNAGALHGRPILPGDASMPGSSPVVVLGYPFWQAAFAGDPGVVGRTIRIADRPFTVVGVSPPDFTGIAELPVDFFIPITMQSALLPGPDLFGPEEPRGVMVIGRLRPDVRVDQAKAALTVWIEHATEQGPESERAIQATLESAATPVSIDGNLLRAVLPLFLPLVVVFGLVLVICCANVSNMMLARALARQKEIGVRLAMGAARSRLIRQLLSENLLLSLLAGAVGFAVSNLAIGASQRVLVATIPPALNLLHVAPLRPDYRVFLFILGASALSTILFGLAPAIQATRTSLVEALRGEFGVRVSSSRLRSMLVVSQISVCVILLVLTGILLRASGAYQRADLGYRIEGVVYPLFLGREDASAPGKLAQKLATEPWVDQWAAALRPPLYETEDRIPVTTAQGSQPVRSGFNIVSPEYFKVLEIPLLRGRTFSQPEAEAEAAVALVSQATARKLWPDGDAIGKSIMVDRNTPYIGDVPASDHVVVIGIAKDVTSRGVISGRDSTMIYFPTSVHAKHPRTFLIRGKGDAASTTRHLEAALTAAVPNRPAIAISLDEMFLTQMYPFWAASWISAMLGGLALLLTLSGMYGVLSYLVGQRTKEIGIRIALGATPGIVVRLVLRQSLQFAAWGVAVGLALAFGGSLVLRHLLTVINAFDAASYALGAAIVVTASLAAAFFPSSRAARINPIETLRAD
jgi:predicted permease